MRRVSIKTFLLSLLVALACSGCLHTRVISVRTSGSKVPSGGMLYALPKTEICVDVTLLHRDTTQAPYAAFAQEMLAGAKQDAPYRIANISVTTRLVADENHYYYVLPRRTALQVDRRHLLQAVGMDNLIAETVEPQPPQVETDTTTPIPPVYNLYDRVDTFYRRGDTPGHPSLTLTKKDARSLRRQAQDVAEQLGNLQDQRRQLIEGDENLSPEVLRYRLKLIDDQIVTLTTLFTGRNISSTVRYVVTPSTNKSSTPDTAQVLFYFSPQRGLVDEADEDAEAVRYTIHRQGSLRSASRFIRFHTGKAALLARRNALKYREAEPAEFIVESTMFQVKKNLPIVQYGPILELPNGKVKARFDAETGELIYLSR